MKVKCPYCGRDTEFIDSKHYYRNGKSYGMIYLCTPCDALCGVHKGTDKPLGSPASKRLRELRKCCHKVFDPLWKYEGMSRTEAYNELARILGVSVEEGHIGMLDARQCIKVLKELVVEKEPHNDRA